jgi:hypothetical protein
MKKGHAIGSEHFLMKMLQSSSSSSISVAEIPPTMQPLRLNTAEAKDVQDR